ncbi:P-loop NTPase fold protein [Arsenophonus nasoniae]|uniref:KAP family P-loop NTPase fold protein n=1 Tax=Arsenophonus nasoniae TaxID=638 RepID=UPI00387A4684
MSESFTDESDFSKGFTEENDIFERRVLYKQIRNVILNSADKNLVLALDDKWGSGKTSFVKMMQGQITESDHKDINIIYFDAFHNDYQSEPLIAMLSSIYELLDLKIKNEPLKDQFLKVSKAVAISVIKQTPKILIGALTKNILNDSASEEIKDSIIEATTEPLENFIEEKIKNSQKHENEIENFKKILKRIYDKTNKKTLFVVDELDRAKPHYSLDLIEKIKHLFNVEGFYFLLVLNREQFKQTIKSRYGDIDASLYLNKFIHIWFTLPKDKLTSPSIDKKLSELQIKNSIIGKYLSSIDQQDLFLQNDHLFYVLTYILYFNGSSLREAQRCYSLISIIDGINKIISFSLEATSLIALIAFLKVHNETLLTRIMDKNINLDEVLNELNIYQIKDGHIACLSKLFEVLSYQLLSDDVLSEMKKSGKICHADPSLYEEGWIFNYAVNSFLNMKFEQY